MLFYEPVIEFKGYDRFFYLLNIVNSSFFVAFLNRVIAG